VTPQCVTTTVVKNKTTERNRVFWSHVEAIAAQSRKRRESASLRDQTRVHDCAPHTSASISEDSDCKDDEEDG